MKLRKSIQLAYGVTAPLIDVFPTPIVTDKPPTNKNFGVPGQIWIDQTNDDVFVLVKQTGTSLNSTQTATWSSIFGGSGVFTSITVGPGTATFNGQAIFNSVSTFNSTTFFNQDIVVDAEILALGNMQFSDSDNDAQSARVAFTKDRSGNIVQTGDDLGLINFQGNDGNTLVEAANIKVEVEGSPASNDVRGRFVFSTADAGSTLQERMIIGRDGGVFIRATDTGLSALTTFGDINATSEDIFAASYFASNEENNDESETLRFSKTRGGGAVQPGDRVGRIPFVAHDGSNEEVAGQIRLEIDPLGTVATDRVPGLMVFSTHEDAAATNVKERMTINRNGLVTVNAPDGGSDALNIAGSTVLSAGSLVVSAGNVSGEQLRAAADNSGVVGSTTFTNGDTASTGGAGTLTIDSQNANSGTNAGFITVYVGTTKVFIPYFEVISP